MYPYNNKMTVTDQQGIPYHVALLTSTYHFIYYVLYYWKYTEKNCYEWHRIIGAVVFLKQGLQGVCCLQPDMFTRVTDVINTNICYLYNGNI